MGQQAKLFLDAIGDNAGLLVKGDDSGFMNKIALAIGDTPVAKPSRKPAETGPAAKQQSHIRQARPSARQATPSGPMAEMLKKILGKKD